jgi:undecaprenyl-diphosphatase
MSILQAIVLGAVQGVAEFFPISSSGHLILVPEIFGWEVQSVAFDAVMHVATLGAVSFAFLPEVKKILMGMLGNAKERVWGRLGWMIIVATIPAGLAGVFLKDMIETTFRDPRVVAGSLIVWGLYLAFADRKAPDPTPDKTVERTNWKQAISVGVAQAIALIPGTSRSGITISTGMLAGMDRETAAKFSFLVGVPAIAGAGALGFVDVFQGNIGVGTAPLIAGFVSAFLSGFIAIRLLLSLVQMRSYLPFVFYRVGLAAFILYAVV